MDREGREWEQAGEEKPLSCQFATVWPPLLIGWAGGEQLPPQCTLLPCTLATLGSLCRLHCPECTFIFLLHLVGERGRK